MMQNLPRSAIVRLARVHKIAASASIDPEANLCISRHKTSWTEKLGTWKQQSIFQAETHSKLKKNQCRIVQQSKHFPQ